MTAKQNHTDTLLINLCEDLERAEGYYNNGDDWTDEQSKAYRDKTIDPLEERIVETPATTPLGLQAKFRLVTKRLSYETFNDGPMWQSFVRDIERMAGGAS